jgi:hypothetical protein
MRGFTFEAYETASTEQQTTRDGEKKPDLKFRLELN